MFVCNFVLFMVDFYFVDGWLSFVVAFSQVDLLIHVGLDLEVGWLLLLV